MITEKVIIFAKAPMVASQTPTQDAIAKK